MANGFNQKEQKTATVYLIKIYCGSLTIFKHKGGFSLGEMTGDFAAKS